MNYLDEYAKRHRLVPGTTYLSKDLITRRLVAHYLAIFPDTHGLESRYEPLRYFLRVFVGGVVYRYTSGDTLYAGGADQMIEYVLIWPKFGKYVNDGIQYEVEIKQKPAPYGLIVFDHESLGEIIPNGPPEVSENETRGREG